MWIPNESTFKVVSPHILLLAERGVVEIQMTIAL